MSCAPLWKKLFTDVLVYNAIYKTAGRPITLEHWYLSYNDFGLYLMELHIKIIRWVSMHKYPIIPEHGHV